MNRIKNVILNKKDIFIILLGAMLPRLIFVFQSISFHVRSDEIGTVAVASYFAGLDWSDVLAEGRYYGFGYTGIFAVLLKLFDNPVLIYRIILFCNVILLGISAVIAYKIEKKYLDVENSKIAIVFALISSYIPYTRGLGISNETPLVFISWILAYLLLELNKNLGKSKKQYLYTALILCTIFYSLLCHTRGSLFYVGFFATVLAVFFAYRKKFIPIIFSIVIAGGGYLVSKKIVDYFVNVVWLVEGNGGLRNTTIDIGTTNIEFLFSPGYLKVFFRTILGQINVMSINTGGIFLIVSIMLLVLCVKKIFSLSPKEKYVDPTFILAVFFGTCLLGSIVGQAIQWLPGAYLSISNGTGRTDSSLVVLAYSRYYSIYSGPLLLAGIVYLCKKIDNVNIPTYVVGIGVIQGLWLLLVKPYITEINCVSIMAMLGRKLIDTTVTDTQYYLMSIVLILLCSVMLLLCRRRRHLLFGIILLFILVYQYVYVAIFYEMPTQNILWEEVNDSFYLVQTVEKNKELPKEIYVVDNKRKTDGQTFFQYQFLFNKYKIVPYLPDSNIEEGIVLSNSNQDYKKLVEKGFKAAQLDANEFIYIKGEELEKSFENSGVDLNSASPYKEEFLEGDIQYNEDEQEYRLNENIYQTSGTYRFTVKTENSEQFEKISVLSSTGNVINEIQIDQEESFIEYSLLGADEINIVVSSTDKGRISSIKCVKIDDRITLGINDLSFNKTFENDIKENNNSLDITYMSYEDINIEYMQKVFPERNVKALSLYSIRQQEGDSYILVEKSNQEWFELLPEYTIIKNYEKFILLAPTNSGVVVNMLEEDRLSTQNRVDLSILAYKESNKYVGGYYEGIEKGEYNIQLQIPESVVNTAAIVEVLADDGIVYTEQKNLTPITEVTWNSSGQMEYWCVKVYSLEGEVIEAVPINLSKNLEQKRNTFDFKFHSIIQSIKSLELHEEVEIYMKNYENNEEKDTISLYMAEDEINTKIMKYRKGIQDTMGSYIIIPADDIDTIFKLLEKYTVIDRTNSYVFLIENEKLNEIFGNDRKIEYLSEGESLKAGYFLVTQSNGSVNSDIQIPVGTYKIYTKIKLNENYQEGEFGVIKLEDSNGILMQESIMISEEDLEKGEIVIETELSTIIDIKTLRVKIYSKYSQVSYEVCNIEKLSEYYEPNQESFYYEGALLESKKIIGVDSSNLYVRTNDICLDTQKYQIEFVYKINKNSKVFFNIMSGGELLKPLDYGDSKKIEENTYSIVTNYTPKKYYSDIVFEITAPADSGFILQSIKVKLNEE